MDVGIGLPNAVPGTTGKQQYVSAFEQAGCDELVFFPATFFPATGDPEQASLFAEALGR
jgi:hypothetical protein